MGKEVYKMDEREHEHEEDDMKEERGGGGRGKVQWGSHMHHCRGLIRKVKGYEKKTWIRQKCQVP